MVARLVARAQGRRDQERPEPGEVFEGLDVGPGVPEQRRREQWPAAIASPLRYGATRRFGDPRRSLDHRRGDRGFCLASRERGVGARQRLVERCELCGERLVEGALREIKGLPKVLVVRLLLQSPSPGGAAAAQARKSGFARRPVRLRLGDAAAGPENRVGAGELVAGRAYVHAGIVEDEVLEVDELALEAQRRAGVGEMPAADEALPHRAFGHSLVEAGEGVLGMGQRGRDGVPG